VFKIYYKTIKSYKIRFIEILRDNCPVFQIKAKITIYRRLIIIIAEFYSSFLIKKTNNHQQKKQNIAHSI